jgi:putative ABC transport system permease protein
VLVACAGLLVRSFAAVQTVDLGFVPDNLLTFQISLPDSKEPGSARRAPIFYDQLIERLDALPQVQSAGGLSLVPMGSGDFSWTYLARDKPAPKNSMLPIADVRIVTPGAFETLQVPMHRGRTFTRTDQARSLPVAIINDSLARALWPGEDPIGKQIKLEGPLDYVPWMTVVGVAADVRLAAPDRAALPTIYRPNTQHSWNSLTIVVRTSTPPSTVMPAIRALVRSIDANVPMLQVRDFSFYLSHAVAQRRVVMLFVTLFAGVALLLALIGVYSVFAYVISLRTREIGIRLALGARHTDVIWRVFRQALAISGLGLIAGLFATLAARRALEAQVFGVGPSDPVTLAFVSTLTLTTALLATFLATRRAARIDSTRALKME